MPGATDVTTSLDSPADLIIIVDCSDERRGGQVYLTAKTRAGDHPPVINIDHHITNTYFGEINLVQPETAATTQVLAHLARAWGVDLDQGLALCLLTGLVTDTLCFRTPNVTPAVMQLVAELMATGVDLAYVTGRTVNRRSFDAIRYWGPLLDTVHLEQGVIWVQATAVDRRAVARELRGDASIVTLLITAWEADMAASFVESDEGPVEASFRARPGFDVANIALQLGGGGHPAASGCTIDGPLDEVVERVVTMMKATRRQQASALGPDDQTP